MNVSSPIPDQKEVVEAARAIFAAKYGHIEPERACVYWAHSFDQAARARGMRSLIQAGSAQFQFRKDDGVSVTHFSYMFEPSQALTRINQGLPPEIHVWNALADTREIIDLTTGFQAAQAKRLIGETWEKDFALPEYLWGKLASDRTVYIPNAMAILYVLRVLKYPVDQLCRSANVERERRKSEIDI